MADFTSFKNTFQGDIVEPSSADYPAAIARWSVTAQRKARVVVFPKDEADISLALRFATSNDLPLAIKCGGHNASGASSIQDGVCIDLSRNFNTARVDPAKELVYVGGGATWDTVDVATIKHGFATPGGTVNHTGVGGLILGGGFGWLSGEHGLVIDNLVQATVVLANGSVVTASATSEPDLFWGLRGGGSNFGVVTEFVLKIHPQRKTVFAGPLIFRRPVLGELTEAIDKWWPSVGEKECAVLFLTRAPDKHPAAVLFLFFNGSEEEGRNKFKHFYNLRPEADFATEIPYERLNSLNNHLATPGRCVYMGGTSLRSQISPHVHEIFDRVASISAAQPTHSTHPSVDVMVGYEFIPFRKVCQVRPDATAFRSRGPQPNVVIVIAWDKASEGTDGTDGTDGLQHARAHTKELSEIIESTQQSRPAENENEGYGNYVSDISVMRQSDKVRQLWGNNYPRLQRIKRQYDPRLVFNRWFPIQPAASPGLSEGQAGFVDLDQ